MAVSIGSIYNLKNSQTGKYLNAYAPGGSVSNGSNVVQFTGDGSAEQKWKLVSAGKDSKDRQLYKMICQNGGYALDRYRLSGSKFNNASLWSNTSSEDASQIVRLVNTTADYYYVILASNEYYLCAYGTANGTSSGTTPTSAGNVFWSSTPSHCLWQFIKTSGGGTSGGKGNGTLTVGQHPSTLDYYSSYYKQHFENYVGQCTWHAYGRAYEVTGKQITFNTVGGWDAGTWYDKVTNCNKSSNPVSNSVAEWKRTNGGHVAYIEKVQGDTVYFTEANADRDNVFEINEDGIVKTLSISSFKTYAGTWRGCLVL